MKCQKCGGSSEVVKVYQFATEARRRRECTKCGHRYTTSERLWRKVYADEIKASPPIKRRDVNSFVKEEAKRRRYSNFDVVALDGYEMDWEDVTTYVHVSDD